MKLPTFRANFSKAKKNSRLVYKKKKLVMVCSLVRWFQVWMLMGSILNINLQTKLSAF